MDNLNGIWEFGYARNYDKETNVPGVVLDTKSVAEENVWYRKEVVFAEGYKYATILLEGARFSPRVYVNGEMVGFDQGGMTRVTILLGELSKWADKKVCIEIECVSLKNLDMEDASHVPEADLWRTNVSSHIWDDVRILYHNDIRVDKIIPVYDAKQDVINIYFDKTQLAPVDHFDVDFYIYNGDKCLLEAHESEDKKVYQIVNNGLKQWNCTNPTLYTLKTIVDSVEYVQTIGLKDFRVEGKTFLLNGEPIVLKMGSIVWHRWLRDSQAEQIAFDKEWFREKFIKPFKKMGGNTVRFHLGPPPQRLLEVCDEEGLIVQIEWLFFHGIAASEESLEYQWRKWLNAVLPHPSIALIQFWNETAQKDHVEKGLRVCNRLEKEYNKLVIAHRDTLHIHKYWFSLSENAGLTYDNSDEFDKIAIADEYGGNYMDYDYNVGGYPTTKVAFERFLGKNHQKKQRNYLQSISYGKYSEYWRSVGVAGFGPYCIISAPEDGNTLYKGNLADGIFKETWQSLSAAFHEVSVCVDTWDKNFVEGQEMEVPLLFFNDSSAYVSEDYEYGICGAQSKTDHITLEPFSRKHLIEKIKLPHHAGQYILYAKIGEAVSKWEIVVHKKNYHINKIVGILEYEEELKCFLEENDIKNTCCLEEADVIVGLKITYEKLKHDEDLRIRLENCLKQGISVILPEIGPMIYGQAYPKTKEQLELWKNIKNNHIETVKLPFGLKAEFFAVTEPESCVHPADGAEGHFDGLDERSCFMWNGMRGGLIMPAVTMFLEGTDREDYVRQWKVRGADEDKIRNSDYYVYHIRDLYEFTDRPNVDTKKRIEEQFEFLITDFDDVPYLKEQSAEEEKMEIRNLHEEYLKTAVRETSIKPIIVAGKGLKKMAAAEISFGEKTGKLLLAQLILTGRLHNSKCGKYELKNDPAAMQMLVNLICNG